MRETPEFRVGSGKDFGIRVHAELAKRAKALDIPAISKDMNVPVGKLELTVERNYRRADRTDGSELVRRPDIVLVLKDKESQKPLAIYDLKTGGADFPDRRVQEFRYVLDARNVLPVIEFRSTETELKAKLR